MGRISARHREAARVGLAEARRQLAASNQRDRTDAPSVAEEDDDHMASFRHLRLLAATGTDNGRLPYRD